MIVVTLMFGDIFSTNKYQIRPQEGATSQGVLELER